MVVPDVVAWPWEDLKPSDFKGPADPNAFQLATRTLTPEQVEALGVDGPEGGFQGVIINGPGDGKLYSFAARPLLPGRDGVARALSRPRRTARRHSRRTGSASS